MRFSLLFLVSLASTSCLPYLTPSFVFIAKECRPVHEFACANESPVDQAWCETHVDAALAEINAAAGHTIAARVPYAPGVSPVIVAPAKAFEKVAKGEIKGFILGLTYMHHDEETMCLAVTPIFLNDMLVNDAWWMLWAQSVVTHEFVHALGGEHAGEGAVSIMTASVTDGMHSMHLSVRDQKTIESHFRK